MELINTENRIIVLEIRKTGRGWLPVQTFSYKMNNSLGSNAHHGEVTVVNITLLYIWICQEGRL